MVFGVIMHKHPMSAGAMTFEKVSDARSIVTFLTGIGKGPKTIIHRGLEPLQEQRLPRRILSMRLGTKQPHPMSQSATILMAGPGTWSEAACADL